MFESRMQNNHQLLTLPSYANSIIQCLYYSAPFREQVINFPSRTPAQGLIRPADAGNRNGALALRNKLVQQTPAVPPASRAEENKDSPEYKKKQAMAAGPVVAMDWENCKRYGMTESLFTCLKDIFEAVIAHDSRIGIVSPQKFLEILRRDNEMFRTPMHQDAHEFLNLLLNDVMEKVEQFTKQIEEKQKEGAAIDGPTQNGLSNALTPIVTQQLASGSQNLTSRWVHELFEGTLTSETRCLTCENVSQRDEPFLDLSVDLAQHSSVTACLRKFSEEEMLCERNKFHCDKCSGLQEAEKRMKIKRLPRILALHLKRFKYTEDFNRLHKLFHRVVYPFHLRLFNTTDDAEDPDRLYELYAVVIHIGGGPYHGHYVSIIKTQDRGWLLFDDEMVEPVDKSFVCNFFGGEGNLACAYVLFYQETTEEAMQREFEAEAEAAANRPVETVRDSVASPLSPKERFMNGILNPHYQPSSSNERVADPHQALARSKTEYISNGRPSSSEAFNTPLAHSPTSPDFASRADVQRHDNMHEAMDAHQDQLRRENTYDPVALRDSRRIEKDSKKEEKAREKEQKRAEKEAEKLRRRESEAAESQRQRDYSNQKREFDRRQDEQLRAAIEASKASKTAEDNSRASLASRDAAGSSSDYSAPAANGHANGGPVGSPPIPSPPTAPAAEKSGGMRNLFRSTSYSAKKQAKLAKEEAEREQERQRDSARYNIPSHHRQPSSDLQNRPLPPMPPSEAGGAANGAPPPSFSAHRRQPSRDAASLLPPTRAATMDANGAATAPPVRAPIPSAPPAAPESKKEKFRFGLGRKKSMMYGGGS